MTEGDDDDLYIVTHVDDCLSDNLSLEQAFITFMNGMYTARRSNIMKEPIALERVKKC